MKVLLIKEDQFVSGICAAELRQENIKVACAQDGKTGLVIAKKNTPNLIIMGLMLPGMSGFDVLKALKSDKTTKIIPVIVSSILGQKKDIDEVFSLGAVKYLPMNEYSPKQIAREVMEALVKLQ
jgi:DNA-binding response OmpR family regulator